MIKCIKSNFKELYIICFSNVQIKEFRLINYFFINIIFKWIHKEINEFVFII